MKKIISISLVCLILCLTGSAIGTEMDARSEAEGASREQVYYEYIITRAYKLRELGAYETWSLDEKAALDRILVEGGYIDITGDNAIFNDIPNEDDVSQEDAIRIAGEAITARYGITVEHSSDWIVECSFLRMNTIAMWDLRFKKKVQVIDASRGNYLYDVYEANVDSPSGAVNVVQNGQFSNGPLVEAEEVILLSNDLSKEDAINIARNAVISGGIEKRGLPEDIF